MSNSRKVVIYTPDDTEIEYTTGAQYDTAGLIRQSDGRWVQIHHGFSEAAVSKRTLTHYRRYPTFTGWCTARIYDATVPCVRKFFGTHKVVIEGYFIPGSEDVHGLRMSASRARIRKLLQQGATQISFQLTGTDRIADFQAAELLKSLRTPTKIGA